MTLAEWAEPQPYIVRLHRNGAMHIPDSTLLVDRARAWVLTDYRVTAVSGGTIWFRRR